MQPEELEFWIDLNLPPVMALWIQEISVCRAKSFKALGFDAETDVAVFKLAKENPATVIITTKDIDFLYIQKSIGPPPNILYINIGNTSNAELKKIITAQFGKIITYFTRTNSHFLEITR